MTQVVLRDTELRLTILVVSKCWAHSQRILASSEIVSFFACLGSTLLSNTNVVLIVIAGKCSKNTNYTSEVTKQNHTKQERNIGIRNGETRVMDPMIIMTLSLFVDSSLWLLNGCSFENTFSTQSVCIGLLPL